MVGQIAEGREARWRCYCSMATSKLGRHQQNDSAPSCESLYECGVNRGGRGRLTIRR